MISLFPKEFETIYFLRSYLPCNIFKSQVLPYYLQKYSEKSRSEYLDASSPWKALETKDIFNRIFSEVKKKRKEKEISVTPLEMLCSRRTLNMHFRNHSEAPPSLRLASLHPKFALCPLLLWRWNLATCCSRFAQPWGREFHFTSAFTAHGVAPDYRSPAGGMLALCGRSE